MPRFPFATLLLMAAPVFAGNYLQAPGSSLVFAGTYQGAVFTGHFPGFSTSLSFNPQHLSTASLDVRIPLATATTANADYDSQMRGNAFFDASKFAQAHYVATRFRSLGGNRFVADGTLTLHGMTRPVALTFTWMPGIHPVLTGKATVKRLDFDVGGGDWADTGLIADDIAISTKVILMAGK